MDNLRKYLIVGCTAVICYFNTFYGSFVFDDTEAIVKNKDVMPYTPLSEVFRNDFWGTDVSLNRSHKSYRPFTVLTYRLNVIFSNSTLNAFHFHVVNVVLYAILCVLLIPTFKLFLRKKKHKNGDDTAFLAALLFTVHPVHVESVAALVGRADVLSAILFFVVILLYRFVKLKESFSLFLVVILLIFVAVLCKETAITVAGFCVIYEVYCLLNHEKGINRWFFIRTLGLVLSSVVILFFRFLVMNFEGPVFTKIDNPAAFSESFLSRVFTYNYIYFLNFLLLLWPEWLCFDWSMGCVPLIETICDIRIVFVFLFWIFILYALHKILREFLLTKKLDARFISVCLICLPFLPASNLFLTVGFVIAERTLLLPSAGYCLLVVLGFKKLQKLFNLNKNIFYLLCVIYTLRTIMRNFDWLNEDNLFTSALKVCPLNAKVHYNVAKIAADNNNKELALDEYRKAIELNSDYEQAMNNLANLLREDKQFKEAEKLLRKALQVRPNFAAAWMNLGIVLTNLNQIEEAERCYLTAISFRNKYPDCYYNLGNLYLDTKRNEEALKAWEMAVVHRPTHTAAWSNMLVLLDSMQKYEEVLELGRNALAHNPKSPALHFSIGNTLGKLQQFEKAEKHFLEALNFNSHNALYYSNLGVLYHRWGKTEKARDMYRRALKLDPNMRTTEKNLRKLTNLQ